MTAGKLKAWTRAVRLQFYPMTWIAYSAGAAAGALTSGSFNRTAYALGYLCLLFIELATVLTNEYYDYPGDRLNKNASPFTGGSRVLVDGQLTFRDLRTAIIGTLCLLAVAAIFFVSTSRTLPGGRIVLMLLAGVFLGLGYTAPPLRFCYRGAGELVVGITHSFYVILCGFVFQAGTWRHSLPWLISIPLFFPEIKSRRISRNARSICFFSFFIHS